MIESLLRTGVRLPIMVQICCICIGLSTSVLVYAQQWHQITKVVTGLGGSAYSTLGTATAVVYDSSRACYWSSFGGYLSRSTDDGETWTVELFDGDQPTWGVDEVSSKQGVSVVGWADRLGIKRIAILDAGRDTWVKAPFEASKFSSIAQTATSLVMGVDETNSRLLCKSRGNDLWAEFPFHEGPPILYNCDLQDVGMDIISVRGNGYWSEYDADSNLMRTTPISQDALGYTYTSVRTEIASGLQKLVGKKKTYILAFSDDAGVTWRELDTLRFQNSPIVLTANSGDDMRTTLIKYNGSCIVIVLTSGHVVSTSDLGKSFRYRGSIDCRSGVLATNSCSILPNGDVEFVDCGSCYRLPVDTLQPLQRLSDNFGLYSVARSPTSRVAITRPQNLALRSTDDGQTWFLTGYAPELVDISGINATGLTTMVVNRIHATDSTAIFGVSENSKLAIRYVGADRGWQALHTFPEVFVRFNDEGDPKYALENFPLQETDSSGLLLLGKREAMRVTDGADTVEVLPTPTEPDDQGEVVRYYQRSSNVQFCLKRMLWRSLDDGKHWEQVGSGLPADSAGVVQTISTMVRLGNGKLLCGIRGYRSVGLDDDTVQRQGGFWVSADEGASWQPIGGQLDNSLCVWYLHRKGQTNGDPLTVVDSQSADTLIAAVANVLTNDLTSSITMNDANLMASVDGGLTWTVVYSEPRRQPATGVRREILSTADSRLIATTVENGLIESADGFHWYPLGGSELVNHTIFDVDVDASGGVYTSTNKGVYRLVLPTSTDDATINIPYRGTEFFTMWTYPTPSYRKLTVRLNNVELVNNEFGTLGLYDMYGQHVSDLTSWLQTRQQSGRVEFDVPLEDLPPGVYFLLLNTGLGQFSSKVLIAPRP